MSPAGEFTTSFVSIFKKVKDNRLLPHGFLPLGELRESCDEAKTRRKRRSSDPEALTRVRIAQVLGDTAPAVDPEKPGNELCDENLAVAVSPEGVDGDPDYLRGGGDELRYVARLREGQRPAYVKATLRYQAIPPFYLQDRFCVAQGPETQRLFFLAGHLNLDNSEADNWALEVVSACGRVDVGGC